MKEKLIILAIIYVCVINIVGFILMFVDKRRAIRGAYRIPEKTLFICAILGGSVGSILGMKLCRHKTKHMKFVAGMPIILIIQIICFAIAVTC